jgi:hypothetical protein
MAGCHNKPAEAHPGRPFLITAYLPDRQGRLVAKLPERCLAAEGDEPCRLRIDHYRERKTGPCFSLAVVRCSTHQVAFTMYPPGHYPYGRVAVAPIAPGGELLLKGDAGAAETSHAEGEETSVATSDAEEDAASGRLDWSLTVFGAAQDASQGQAWPREKPSRWRTQGRWLQLGAQLLGIGPVTDGTEDEQRYREQMAGMLGVPALHVLEGARHFRNSRGYRERGRVVLALLARLPTLRSLGERILAAGAIAGLWGRPSRWDPGGRGGRP